MFNAPKASTIHAPASYAVAVALLMASAACFPKNSADGTPDAASSDGANGGSPPDSSPGSDAHSGADATPSDTSEAAADAPGTDASAADVTNGDARGPDGGDVSVSSDGTADGALPADASDAAAVDGHDDAADAMGVILTDSETADTGKDAGLTCPGDLSSLPYATGTLSATDVPAFTGGSIQDGEYVATSFTAYSGGACNGGSGSCPNAAGAIQASLTFAGGVLRLDEQAKGQSNVFCYVGPYTISGNMIVFPSTGSFYQYYVSSDGLTLYVEYIPGGSCSWANGAASGQCATVGTYVRQ
jgi:hypothetical protein